VTAQELDRRKRVMQRSQKLGHCICDPHRPCPCDQFKQETVCHCAGERPKPVQGPVRLTEHVRNAGCASKISKSVLHEVLAGLPEIDDPRVIVGASAGDDAGVMMLGGDHATILTVDVFCPSVDDPYTFGQIAAANSLSDIYAMGGKPDVALSVIGFPVHTLPLSVMRDILRGGLDKMKEAGVPVIGGHSINDEEVKCGFAVVGSSPAQAFVRNAGAQVGDVLVLTKPLGSGIVAFAHQIGRAPQGAMSQVAASMASLNKLAGELMVKRGAHAATDVTGFSLLGHLVEIVRNSQVEVSLDFDVIPLFDGVASLAAADVLPGAVERTVNRSIRSCSTFPRCRRRSSRSCLALKPPAACLSVSRRPMQSSSSLICMPGASRSPARSAAWWRRVPGAGSAPVSAAHQRRLLRQSTIAHREPCPPILLVAEPFNRPIL
jgi:selenide, water dikinase